MRAELDDLADRRQAILVVGELMADELLRLELVRRDDARLRARREAQRLTFGVEHAGHAELAYLGDQTAVEVGRDAARQAAREDAYGGALGQVEQLVDEQLELAGGDARAALVDLRLLVRGRVDDRGRRARLLADADEVAQDRLGS